jgi:putative GTP pyrophosphokinase
VRSGAASGKPFIAERVRQRSGTNRLYRQQAVLLAYLATYENPATLKAKWPLTEEDLRPVFLDVGKNLDDF